MPGLDIPPWIQAADPAANMARGLQIGTEIGAKQAAQRFAEMQLAREREQHAEEQALNEAKFGLAKSAQDLEAKQAAAKMQAQMQYQQAVAGGMDPLKALVQFGPSMTGQASAEAAAIRSQQLHEKMAQQQPLSWQPFEEGGVKGVMRSDQQKFVAAPRPEPTAPTSVNSIPVLDPSGKPVEGMFAVPSATGKGVTVHSRPEASGKLSQADRDELHQLERDQDKLQAAHEKDIAGPAAMTADQKTLSSFAKAALKKYKDRQKQIDDLDSRIKDIRAKARGDVGAAPAPGPAEYVWDDKLKRVVRRPDAGAQSPDASD